MENINLFNSYEIENTYSINENNNLSLRLIGSFFYVTYKEYDQIDPYKRIVSNINANQNLN